MTHWDRYAGGCTGVCIGFNMSSLLVFMKRMGVTAVGRGGVIVGKFCIFLKIKKK